MTAKKETKENAEQSLENLLQRVSTLQQIASKLFPELSLQPLVTPVPTLQARDMKFGQLFRRKGLTGTFLRVRPVSYLLNSTLVSESLANGKVLIVNPENGSCFFITGDEEVVPMNTILGASDNAKQSQ